MEEGEGVGGVRDSAVSCPPRPPPGPSAAFLQEISSDLQPCTGMSLMEGWGEVGGGALISEWREATGRRVWMLERYKETCVNPGAPHKDTEKELHAAGQLINLTPDSSSVPWSSSRGKWRGRESSGSTSISTSC